MSRRVDLSKNQLARLPDELAQFEHLEMLCCARNQLVALPPSLGCSLTSLDLPQSEEANILDSCHHVYLDMGSNM